MEVNPAKQNIDQLFSNTNYHIDFYQREYKWDADVVGRLIEDVFYHFDQSYQCNQGLDPSVQNITSHYSWYYLNTYITNRADGRIFVVDGQQRLTTLTLILIALHRMCSPDSMNSPDLCAWIGAKIVGVGIGGKKQFWMAHEKRSILMQALLAGATPTSEMIDDGITGRHLIDNFAIIQKDLSARIGTRHKLDTFIYYFLCMVVIINLELIRK